jgi:hypothetical protein
MKKSIKLVSLLMCLMMVLALAACGSSAPADDPNLGVYKLSSLMGFSLDEYAKMLEITPEEAANSMTLELKADGKADMTADGDKQTLDWSVKDGAITLTDGKESLEGTIKDGTVTLNIEGMEIVFTK